MKYSSKYSPDKKVTPAQYITELVCEQRANSLKLILPVRFWTRPEWANFYKFQLKKAYEYLSKYDASILIKVIKDKNIFSLNAQWIESHFIKETELSQQIQPQEKTEHTRIINSKGKTRKKKDFGKLDG